MIVVLRKAIFVLIIPFLILMGLFFISQNSKSYDDKTTHPALTDEIVDFYNLSFDDKLTPEEKEWVVQGSIDEDTPPRWINHFYDPIYKVGWSGENTGIWPTMVVQYFSQGALSSEEPVSSLDWLHNQSLQAKYGAYYGNRTWERAIYEAVKNGNKKEAYYTLGHILHLIEDATVPDHTRNDTHAHELRFVTGDSGSPYEEFSKQSKRDNLDIAKELKQINETPISKSSIDEYLISLAEYSNKHFFSKDTINNPKYQLPKIVKTDDNFGYGVDENNKEFPLVNAETSFGVFKKLQINYYLPKEDNNSIVLKNYFSRLSRQAVLNGAGVINLFKQEVAKSEKDKLKDLPAETASIWSITGRFFQIKNALASVYQTISNTLSGILTPPSPEMLVAQLSSVGGNIDVSNQTPPPSAQTPSIPVSLPQSASTSPTIIPAPTNILPPDSNSWEKATSTAPIAEFVAEFAATATTTITTATTTATTTIPIVSSYQGGGYVSGVSPSYDDCSALCVRGLPADALLAANTTTQTEQQLLPPDSNSWGEGTSTNATLPIISDVNATGTTATSTIIVWTTNESADSQVEYGTTMAYGIFSALDGATTTTHQVVLSDLSASTTYHYISTSRDSAGNLATSTDSEFTTLALPTEQIIATTTASTLPDILPGYFNAPVVINEIAWMGTAAAPDDEWIELYNKTSQPIDLTGWTLENGKQSLKINLKGMIQPRSYYLLGTASTTTDQEEDMVYTGAMPNSGQVANLYLKNASSSIIDHIHQWYAGDNNSKNTMERISPYVRGETPSNWGTYISSTSTPPFAKDADGNDIFGTPKAKNSVSTYTPVIDQINQNITWYKELSPYYAIYKIGVAREAVLTIQPGVTAKFTNGTGLEISGSLQAEGIESDPIIFTSNSQTPKPGDWLNIIFSNPNQTSKLKYAQIQYGGQGINYNPNSSTPTYTGAVSIINSSPIIANSTFDNNQSIAIYIAGNSNPKITGNIIKNTDSYTYKNGPVNGFGIQLADGGATAEISNNTIERNSIGIKSASASTTPLIIKDNVFSNNGVNGEFQTNTFLNLNNSGNQDLNKQSGFVLKLNLISNQTTTLKKDILPYIISEYLVISASSTVVVEPGVVFKNSMGYYGDSYWRVYGVLKAKGTLDQPIIFTSASDDIDGYNQGGQPKPGDWNRLYFNGDIASQSEVDYAFFRYGGRMCIICTREGYCRQSDGAVLIENSSPTITNSTFEFNNQPDMKIRGASSPILENNTLGEIVRE